MKDIFDEIYDGQMLTLTDTDPVKRAQKHARQALPKRFYKSAQAIEGNGLFEVRLDGRLAKSPARRDLAFRSRQVAEMVVNEWDAVRDEIDPTAMPATRIVNSAIDGVADDPGPVLDEIIRFASGDLLCYRADTPEGLVAKQARHWDPVIDWIREACGARFRLTAGVMHIEQDDAAIETFRDVITPLVAEPVTLAAAHVMTTLTGSALLTLAILKRRLDGEEAWRAAHVDEDWQISLWGEDAEAAARRCYRYGEMKAAVNLALAGS